jgi:hypothetical protein
MDRLNAIRLLESLIAAPSPFEAIALTGFVLAGNTLLRPRVNAINRTPINQGTAEARH